MILNLSENKGEQNYKPVSIKFSKADKQYKMLSRHVSFGFFQVKSDFMDTRVDHLDKSARFR